MDMGESGIESGYGRKGSVIVATRKQRRRGDMDAVALEHNHTAAQNQDEKVKRERGYGRNGNIIAATQSSPPLSLSCDRCPSHPVHPGRYNHQNPGCGYNRWHRIFHRVNTDGLRMSSEHARWSHGGTGRVFKRNPFLCSMWKSIFVLCTS